MSAMEMINVNPAERRTVIDIARELGAIFGERANAAKDEDKFVADNFSLLNTSGLVEAGVPPELGGGGASVDELCGDVAHAGLRTAARPRWRLPCIRTRSSSRLGDGTAQEG